MTGFYSSFYALLHCWEAYIFGVGASGLLDLILPRCANARAPAPRTKG